MSLHVGTFICDLADHLFGRFAFSHLLLKICERLDIEEGCDVGHKEVVQPVGLVRIEGLKRGFVENQDRPLGHESSPIADSNL